MSFPHNTKTKTQAKRLNQDQVRLLESSFNAGKKLEPERKFQLARKLGVPPRQIAIWYQNKRARWKSQTLELDYGALQLRLEAALADNRQLERQVVGLLGELKRVQDALWGLGQQQPSAAVAPPVSSLSSCCGDDGGGSSSLNDDVGCSGNWENGESLRFEELYACLMLEGVSTSAKGSSNYDSGCTI